MRVPEECRDCLLNNRHGKYDHGCELYVEFFPRWGRDELRKEGLCPGRYRVERRLRK